MSERYDYFAPCPKGLETPLVLELSELHALDIQPRTAGVAFRGSLETGYRACLWCRTAARILLELDRFPAPDPDALYAGALDFPFEEHFGVDRTFAVEFTSTSSEITHTNFGALKVKDAIADRFRSRRGVRPSVDRERPDVRFHVHVHEQQALLYLDMSGERLHRRAWRTATQEAPLKENLAAGILLLAKWPDVARRGGGLVDPMCGSGTFLVEAALMALDVAPGLTRAGFGFEQWAFHRPSVWGPVFQDALSRDRRKIGLSQAISGSDNDEQAVNVAIRNLEEAGIRGVLVLRRELALAEPVGDVPGIVVTNPPYGVRLQPGVSLDLLYKRIGMTLKARFPQWTGFVFTGNPEAAKHLGLRVARRYPLFNGALECRLLEVPVLPPKVRDETAVSEATNVPNDRERVIEGQVPSPSMPPPDTASAKATDPGDSSFANRIRKNLDSLRKWKQKEGVTCYRLYDADIPEFAFTIDVYEQWVHLQEGERPFTVDPLKAESRLHHALESLQEILQVPAHQIFVKQRFHQRGNQQYGRLGSQGAFQQVQEGGLKFLVNLTDYFDAGLFLDHRPIRSLIRQEAQGKHVLNLFAYTGSASVYAAAGGAATTTTVDLSATYIDWARKNLELNGFFGIRHRLIEEDVLTWLEQERSKYDLVFLDPPTFSNSKAMRQTFDVQRDHVALIRQVLALLNPNGVLYFSNNFRRFKLDYGALADLAIQDVTRKSIPLDFARDAKAHQAYVIRRNVDGF